jgi:hypothetical protein
MFIDTEKLDGWDSYAASLIKLAVREQAKYEAKLRKHEAAKIAAALVAEVQATPQPPGLTEIDRLTREVERLDLAIDKAGIDRSVKVDGAGLRRYEPLVAMLRQARWRLKRATEARERVLSMTGGNLFGRSL